MFGFDVDVGVGVGGDCRGSSDPVNVGWCEFVGLPPPPHVNAVGRERVVAAAAVAVAAVVVAVVAVGERKKQR